MQVAGYLLCHRHYDMHLKHCVILWEYICLVGKLPIICSWENQDQGNLHDMPKATHLINPQFLSNVPLTFLKFYRLANFFLQKMSFWCLDFSGLPFRAHLGLECTSPHLLDWQLSVPDLNHTRWGRYHWAA